MNIAVVGAGVMGKDVALVCAAYGHDVVIYDNDPDVKKQLRTELRSLARKYRMMNSLLARWNTTEMIERIDVIERLEELRDVDWVVENVSESTSLKQRVWSEIAAVTNAATKFAVNTSCVPIESIAERLPGPERVVGMHFMNPVPLIDAVEVVRAPSTSEDTIDAVDRLMDSIGKQAIVVNDSPGFVSNRLSHLFMNEAARLVEEGVAEPAQIDAIFRDGYGHRMGPLETADLIGLDTVADSLDVLESTTGDPKFRCCDELRNRVATGEVGRKSGAGFYDYARDEVGTK